MVNKVLSIASNYIGIEQGSTSHKTIIDRYNAVRPLPVSYKVKYSDDWCDAFLTVVGDEAGASHLIGRECGVQRHINIFNDKGLWLGKIKPKAGDIVTFDWDGAGWADHIGFVEKVEDDMITTIEGNTSSRVARNKFKWNDWRIKGYARPKYQASSVIAKNKTNEQIAREIVAGEGDWGNGNARKIKLEANGYNYKQVQGLVNDILKQAKQAKVKSTATHWQTGETIASWVKGNVYDIADDKQIGNKKSYLLMNGVTAIGWIWSNDVELV